ncbi:4'-phosphopantetheinyl transferase superfamily protein [Bradyrhizobium sp. Tv2a-2]|uniref:4'-phosphopantetheinyl transferase family protein n=1 Tax=Bradyrhizobium sp. Tv2a-2 TaxID=113395 RepID=UPI000464C529|nr:4'-phosphopantetheinyl transferase superfamily protein [Bradyrhizobium sp. Tv2a-2]
MAGEGIELYVGLIAAIDTEQALESCRMLLSAEERHRAGCFVHERHQRLYTFAHGLLRVALSNSEPAVAPADWSFVVGPHGRPFVAAPGIARPIYFSLSHTEGCVACAISRVEAVGLDVERMEPRGSIPEIAEHAFAPDEVEALRGLAPDQLFERFFDYWTLKEAYIKAMGIGLQLPLDQFAISLADNKIAISFTDEIDDDPQRWHFTRLSPSTRHRLAIADGSGIPGGLPIVMRPWPVPTP